jgi:hypothetical protein
MIHKANSIRINRIQGKLIKMQDQIRKNQFAQ